MSLIPASLSGAVARQLLAAQRNAPTLLFAGGVAGSVGSTVLACRATLKTSDIVDHAQRKMEQIRATPERLEELKADPETAEEYKDEVYTEDDVQKDITRVYIGTALAVAREFAPAILLGAASIAMLSKSHNLLMQRNAAMTAAYVALERGFDEYRSRVREKYGEDAERAIRFPRERVKEHNEATGREHTVEILQDIEHSPYAKFFDELCHNFQKGPYGSEENLIFLKNKQNFWNDMLKSRGYVFLNDVYHDLGIDGTGTGAVCGWILGGPNSDNYIDFGLYNEDGTTRDFINGREKAILLDFNCDGLIVDKLNQIDKGALAWPTRA